MSCNALVPFFNAHVNEVRGGVSENLKTILLEGQSYLLLNPIRITQCGIVKAEKQD